MSEKNTYKILNKNEDKAGELELTIEIPADAVDGHRSSALKDLAEGIEVPGFRKGKAPENMVLERVGEMRVLERAAYRVIEKTYPQILSDEKIESLTQPNISITKIAIGNPLEFKLNVILMPKVELPDYKKIAKSVLTDKNAETVTDKEVDDYIDHIRKMRAQSLQNANHSHEHKHEDGEKCEHGDEKCEHKNEKNSETDADKKEPELPELNDEFVKALGDFKDVADFKTKLKENMMTEKTSQAGQKRRLEIIEQIVKETKITIPDILIEEELRKMTGQFRHDVEQMKMNFEEYLDTVKKTEEDLKKEWRPDAEKRAKMNLILPKIAVEEKLQPNPDEIAREVIALKNHHKDLDQMHATMYVAHVLTNEEVFKFLERQ